MKKLLFIPILFLHFIGIGQAMDFDSIVVNPFIIGNLEIAQYDFPTTFYWEKANIACRELGNGWRLPNKDELNILYQNKNKIGTFSGSFYWSSDGGEKKYRKSVKAWGQGFYSGKQTEIIGGAHYVRAVRTKNKATSFEADSIIGKPFKLGNFEIAQYTFTKKITTEMNFFDAKAACRELGSGWRLPTIDELDLLFQNKDKIGIPFKSNYYWSSTVGFQSNFIWTKDFVDGSNGKKQIFDKTDGVALVRAVRSL